jgi:hypothetical protein
VEEELIRIIKSMDINIDPHFADLKVAFEACLRKLKIYINKALKSDFPLLGAGANLCLLLCCCYKFFQFFTPAFGSSILRTRKDTQLRYLAGQRFFSNIYIPSIARNTTLTQLLSPVPNTNFPSSLRSWKTRSLYQTSWPKLTVTSAVSIHSRAPTL